MKISIGQYDAASRTVAATFRHGGVTHRRAVNACHDGAGGYDKAATATRVDAVARGVAVKIAAGAVSSAPAA
ncbi:MAG TPA: hypothetical protein VNQ31_01140 [Sphingomonadaceae bacterium]|nr:hypothetical protein [Sphingomonadaceae bacterium]